VIEAVVGIEVASVPAYTRRNGILLDEGSAPLTAVCILRAVE
jgi:hypothetical protein